MFVTYLFVNDYLCVCTNYSTITPGSHPLRETLKATISPSRQLHVAAFVLTFAAHSQPVERTCSDDAVLMGLSEGTPTRCMSTTTAVPC